MARDFRHRAGPIAAAHINDIKRHQTTSNVMLGANRATTRGSSDVQLDVIYRLTDRREQQIRPQVPDPNVYLWGIEEVFL